MSDIEIRKGSWKSHVAECSFVIKGLIVFKSKLSICLCVNVILEGSWLTLGFGPPIYSLPLLLSAGQYNFF